MAYVLIASQDNLPTPVPIAIILSQKILYIKSQRKFELIFDHTTESLNESAVSNNSNSTIHCRTSLMRIHSLARYSDKSASEFAGVIH